MKFAHIDTNTNTVIQKLRQHPRADGGEVQGLIPGTAIVPIERPPRPDYNRITHNAEQVEKVTATAVVMAWEIVPKPLEAAALAIKLKAGEVIEESLPAHKQRNLLAASMQLMDAKSKSRRSSKDKKQVAAAKEIFAWVLDVREEADKKIDDVSEGKEIDIDDWPEFPA